jgi:phosphatidate cytidylyltransferase
VLQRSKSAIVIVLVGIIPAILGGPIFAAAFTAIGLAAYYEFLAMCGIADTPVGRVGYLSIVAFASVALLTRDPAAISGVLAFGVFAPLIRALLLPVSADNLVEWALTAAGTMYLGLPVFAAISLRQHEGLSGMQWVNDLADMLNPGDTPTGAGMGWFLFVLLVIWLSDTFAYLVGKQFGRNKLIPHISPNKTVEGAIGGLTAAAITGALCAWAFGMDLHPAAGFGLAAAIAVAGMLGDLAESLIKRQVGVKDSGNLIPGHGGIFDRIDALIFGLVIAWIALPWLG